MNVTCWVLVIYGHFGDKAMPCQNPFCRQILHISVPHHIYSHHTQSGDGDIFIYYLGHPLQNLCVIAMIHFFLLVDSHSRNTLLINRFLVSKQKIEFTWRLGCSGIAKNLPNHELHISKTCQEACNISS